jgi:sigma-B regulation protein RsbU (phosphoserine phosphatase)
MTDHENQRLLAQVPLFATLPPDELDRLAATLRTVDVSDNTILFHEGDAGDHFYVVRDGQAEIVKAIDTDDERIVAVRRPGEFVGEMSLFNQDGLRTASVRARGAARFWLMTRAEFDALLHCYPMLAYEMVRVQSERLSAAHNNALHDLIEKNRQLQSAYDELKTAQAQIIEKEKLEKELQVAAHIQMSILPHTLPRVPGYDFGARMIPARAVGGDWFDFIPFDDSHLGIVVGDVSDKGVPAAIFMAQTHALLRAEAHLVKTPRATLEQVNQHLAGMNAAGMFVTALYGILNCADGAFVYARAGHELPLVCANDGTMVPCLNGQGQPLGIFPDPIIDEQTVTIPSGGMLLLFTDGVTDCANPAREFFELERLQAALHRNIARAGQATCDELLQTLIAFQSSAPQQDDITLVAVHSQA